MTLVSMLFGLNVCCSSFQIYIGKQTTTKSSRVISVNATYHDSCNIKMKQKHEDEITTDTLFLLSRPHSVTSPYKKIHYYTLALGIIIINSILIYILS